MKFFNQKQKIPEPDGSGFFVKVELVELTVLILTLFYQGSAAVYVYVEVLIQFYYALVKTVLFLDRTLAYVKLIL